MKIMKDIKYQIFMLKMSNFMMKDFIILVKSFYIMLFIINLTMNNKVTILLNNDLMSSIFSILTMWMLLMMIMLNNNFNVKKLNVMITLLLFSLLLFNVNNLLLFYISFEFMFPMMLLIIYIWGKSYERFMSSSYFFMYGMMGSMPMLLGLLMLMFMENTMMMNMISKVKMSTNMIMFMLILISFFLKTAFYWFHFWLPKAHVESPTEGSMFLASIMMKFGIYGMMRFKNFFLVLKNSWFFTLLCISISVGSLYSILMCIKSKDFKQIVAYSSVSHMSFCILILLTMKDIGFIGLLLMSVSHGIISPSLFFMSNTFYLLFNNRNMNFISSLKFKSVIFFILFSVLFMLNMGIPPSLNFLSELTIVMINFMFSSIFMMLIGLYFILFMLMFSKIIIEKSMKSYNMFNSFLMPVRDQLFLMLFTFTSIFMFYMFKMFM